MLSLCLQFLNFSSRPQLLGMNRKKSRVKFSSGMLPKSSLDIKASCTKLIFIFFLPKNQIHSTCIWYRSSTILYLEVSKLNQPDSHHAAYILAAPRAALNLSHGAHLERRQNQKNTMSTPVVGDSGQLPQPSPNAQWYDETIERYSNPGLFARKNAQEQTPTLQEQTSLASPSGGKDIELEVQTTTLVTFGVLSSRVLRI